MARKSIDCRDFPSEKNCTVVIAADAADEVLDVAVLHAVSAHGHENTRELREQLRQGVKETSLT